MSRERIRFGLLGGTGDHLVTSARAAAAANPLLRMLTFHSLVFISLQPISSSSTDVFVGRTRLTG